MVLLSFLQTFREVRTCKSVELRTGFLCSQGVFIPHTLSLTGVWDFGMCIFLFGRRGQNRAFLNREFRVYARSTAPNERGGGQGLKPLPV